MQGTVETANIALLAEHLTGRDDSSGCGWTMATNDLGPRAQGIYASVGGHQELSKLIANRPWKELEGELVNIADFCLAVPGNIPTLYRMLNRWSAYYAALGKLLVVTSVAATTQGHCDWGIFGPSPFTFDVDKLHLTFSPSSFTRRMYHQVLLATAFTRYWAGLKERSLTRGLMNPAFMIHSTPHRLAITWHVVRAGIKFIRYSHLHWCNTK
jgi:hypothetical protein